MGEQNTFPKTFFEHYYDFFNKKEKSILKQKPAKLTVFPFKV